MSDSDNIPAIATPAVLAGVPSALVPASIKAIDRLIGAAVDIPVALLRRQTAKIEAKTKSYEAVEAAIASAAADEAGADPEIADRALSNLIRREYRKQANREAVAAKAIDELRVSEANTDSSGAFESPSPDEDWLNVFERFAEDASTERMQNLWGRVLAGELRKPGAFSLRTLRFLSEFSQTDALQFAAIAEFAVGSVVLKKLAKPDTLTDIRHLIQLEAAGLLTGASNLGLTNTIGVTSNGHAFLGEGNLTLVFRGEPDSKFKFDVMGLTPLGVELLSLVPERDIRRSMRLFAHAVRTSEMTAAFIGHVIREGHINFIEELWQDQVDPTA